MFEENAKVAVSTSPELLLVLFLLILSLHAMQIVLLKEIYLIVPYNFHSFLNAMLLTCTSHLFRTALVL